MTTASALAVASVSASNCSARRSFEVSVPAPTVVAASERHSEAAASDRQAGGAGARVSLSPVPRWTWRDGRAVHFRALVAERGVVAVTNGHAVLRMNGGWND